MTPNGNTDRLLGALDEGVRGLRAEIKDFKSEVERDFQSLKDDHHSRLNNHGNRLATLELDKSSREGGAKMLAGLLSAAAVLGSIVGAVMSTVIGKLWPS